MVGPKVPPMAKVEPFPFPNEVYPDDWFSRLEREDLFPGEAPIELDLGCGDGSFLARMAKQFPERNFLGVERLLGRVRWPKKKHANRRQMCRIDFLAALHSLLVDDGELLFMTDDEPYFLEALEAQKGCDFFVREPWEEGDFFYARTDFEEQWLAAGRTMHRLRLRKLPRS